SLSARDDGILLPFLVSIVVEVVAVLVWDGRVVLLDAAFDLFEDSILQGPRLDHHRVRVGIPGLQVGDDLRILTIAKPEIRIDPGVAVIRELDGLDFRDGWRRM